MCIRDRLLPGSPFHGTVAAGQAPSAGGSTVLGAIGDLPERAGGDDTDSAQYADCV